MNFNKANIPVNKGNANKSRFFLILLILAGVISFLMILKGTTGLFMYSTESPLPLRSDFLKEESYNKSVELYNLGSQVRDLYFTFSIIFSIVGALTLSLTVYGIGKNIEKYMPLNISKILPRSPKDHALSYVKLFFVTCLYIVGLGLNVIGVWLLSFYTIRSPLRVVNRMILATIIFPLMILLLILIPIVVIPKFSYSVTLLCLKLEDVYFPLVEEFKIKK